MLYSCLLPLFLALPLAAQEPPPAPVAAQAEAKVEGVDVTFLANEGFYLESGRYGVLIDAFVREPTEPYGALPAEVHKQLANAKPPFDKLTVVLVSHDHPDHVQMRGLEKYLEHNPMAQLFSSPQVVHGLSSAAQDFEAIARRVTPVQTTPGSIKALKQEDVRIDFFQLAHGGKGNEKVLNLGHLIEMGGLRILHVGDAEPAVENFAAYDLKARKIDIAFVPYWFFGKAGGTRVLNEQIQARVVVACHVPPKEEEKLQELLTAQFPQVVMFKEALEKRHFDPLTAPAQPTQSGPGGG